MSHSFEEIYGRGNPNYQPTQPIHQQQPDYRYSPYGAPYGAPYSAHPYTPTSPGYIQPAQMPIQRYYYRPERPQYSPVAPKYTSTAPSYSPFPAVPAVPVVQAPVVQAPVVPVVQAPVYWSPVNENLVIGSPDKNFVMGSPGANYLGFDNELQTDTNDFNSLFHSSEPRKGRKKRSKLKSKRYFHY